MPRRSAALTASSPRASAPAATSNGHAEQATHPPAPQLPTPKWPWQPPAATDWQAWLQVVQAFAPRLPFECGPKHPLGWNLPETGEAATAAAVRTLICLDKLPRKATPEFAALADVWLAKDPDETDIQCGGAEALAWAYALPATIQLLPEETWWQLLARLLELATVERDPPGPDMRSDATLALGSLWLSAELPLILARSWPEISECTELAPAASSFLRQGLDELLDGDGQVAANLWAIARPFLACCLRCRELAEGTDFDIFDESATTQLTDLIAQNVRNSRPDGRQLLCSGAAGAWSAELFSAALADQPLAALASEYLPKLKGLTKDKAAQAELHPCNHSEWGQSAVLRNVWNKTAASWTVLYHEPQLQVALDVAGQTLVQGTWHCTLADATGPLPLQDDWDAVCWLLDEDVAYLELQMALPRKKTLQRQMLVSRKDRFAFLAETVIGSQVERLELTSEMPLGPEITLSPLYATRELTLQSPGGVFRVAPLTLPEWRSDHRLGDFQPYDRQLRLTQKAEGFGLSAVWWFDLDPQRIHKPLTWRQLTVAGQREIVSPRSAVGQRVQVGREQWLSYRSFTESANRTLLGKNLNTEFYVGRFTAKGLTETIAEIES